MAEQIIRRALLYVPSSSKKMLDKSRGLTVDTVIYDLEDSVTPGRKQEARSQLRDFLDQPRAEHIREQAVRINSVESGLALDDLTEVLKAPHLDAIVVPKVTSPSDLHFITDVLRHKLPHRHPTTTTPSSQHTHGNPSNPPPIRLLALIESARAVLNLPHLCASTPYLSGLIFAAEDFARDLSLTRTPSLREFLYARSAVVTAARAFCLPSTIDLVCTAYRGEAGTAAAAAAAALARECADGRQLGFNGKQVIHPAQVETVQRAFGPVEEDVVWAVRVLVADDKAAARGRGAWTLDGKMIDAPVVGWARATLERAGLCGWDVQALRREWAAQEPE